MTRELVLRARCVGNGSREVTNRWDQEEGFPGG